MIDSRGNRSKAGLGVFYCCILSVNYPGVGPLPFPVCMYVRVLMASKSSSCAPAFMGT